MKKAIFFIFLSALAFSSFSQKANPATLTKQDYLKKSKKQKTTAWILLAGGATVGFIGLTQFNFAGSDDPDFSNGPATVMFLTGTTAVITSIPIFKASKRNKKRAASVSFIIDRVPVLQTKGLASINYPAVSFRLRFK